MKKEIALFLILMLAGCRTGAEFLKDPHYQSYLEKQDDLESSYLEEKISYDEYLKQKRQLDTDYSREVKDRERKIQGEK